MIEILITLLILAIGLLGLAALQGVSLQTSQVSYYRTQATNVGYEVADFARSNSSRITQGALQAMGENLARQRLPDGVASVIYSTANGAITVDISWLDDRSGSEPSTAEFSFQSRI